MAKSPLIAVALLASTSALAAERVAVAAKLVPPGTAYSPGLLAGDTLYVSGLQGTDRTTHKLPADFQTEVRDCLANLATTLKDAGMSERDLVSVTVYLTDMSLFDSFNTIYKSYAKTPYPARTTLGVSALSLSARIEVSAIAKR